MVVGDIGTAVDVVVIGGGPGGYVSAIRAAQLGKQVVLVDANLIGGTCLNFGCIPSKALLTAAERAWQVSHSQDMGVAVQGSTVDFAKMQSWKRQVVDQLTNGVTKLLKANKVQVVQGKAWFLNDGEVRVEGPHGALKYLFEKAIIATGAEAQSYPGLSFDGERVLTPSQTLQLNELPTDLTVIGSDYIAAEIATIFSKLGVSVHLLLPPQEHLLNEFDETAGRQVGARLKKLGVKIEKNVADMVTASESASVITISRGGKPRTNDLKLANAGVVTNADGWLRTNQQMQTNDPDIYAVGDVTGGLHLATVAIKHGKVAAESIAGLPVAYAPQAVPLVAWTDPQVASVGLTSAQAAKQGYDVLVGRFPFGANGRALTLDAPNGTVLTVSDRRNELLLGVTIIAPQASEMIGEAALALEMGATLTDLAETLHPHPGLGEALQESTEAALAKAVHILKQ